jgi:hypothetical protein
MEITLERSLKYQETLDLELLKNKLLKIKDDFEGIDTDIKIECNIKYMHNDKNYNASKRIVDKYFIDKIKKENNIPDNDKITISLDDVIKIFGGYNDNRKRHC